MGNLNLAEYHVVEQGPDPFTLETGRMARQSDGAVMVTFGETKVLATVNRSDVEEDIDYFPLTVDYEEKFYAGGKIPGGFFKREGKPSEEAVLSARMIDRPIRPLFPEGYRERIHVVATVLSADKDHPPEIAGMLGVSAALMISSVPFLGPIAGVRVGLVDGQIIINPTAEQREASLMDIVVAGTEEAVTMVEGDMKEIPEDQVIRAIQAAHEEIKRLVGLQREFVQKVPAKPKVEATLPEGLDELRGQLRELVWDRFEELWGPMPKLEREDRADQIRDEAIEQLLARKLEENPQIGESEQKSLQKTLKTLFKELLREFVRTETLKRKVRMDGRRADEIRPITIDVGVLPRVHGSALFTRGETQSLGTCTLGTTRQDEQIIDLMLEEGRKRFMLHYNFPPYSVGETGRLGPPKRREIGHGHLAESAIRHVLPDEEEFPYIIRVVSEILESNGSSSMASVCSGTLALMDAGVPIKKPVAGIAMGLIEEEGDAMVLTDIAGFEDGFGDMDFKVAGTDAGVTAFQMDVKVGGVSEELMAKAMEQARQARLHILEKMAQVLPAPRPQLSKYAPLIEIIKINPEKIGAVIGPGGKMIRKILAETGAEIDIDDDGTVKISGTSAEAVKAARAQIEDLTKEIQVGDRFRGRVVRIERFGALVELKPGVSGLVHVSDLSDKYVKKVEDVVKLGDELEVEVIEIDPLGRLNLKRVTEKKPIEVGERYPGVVKGLADYGAFVEFNEGETGLIHISTLKRDGQRVRRVEDVLSVGEVITVEVARIDEKGRYSLVLVEGDGPSAEESQHSEAGGVKLREKLGDDASRS
jgi:polyribonucleotide nucleotidyltransferase